MIKEAFAQCNIQYLEKIFEVYTLIHDENEILKIGGRIVQKSDKINEKSFLIKLFDNFYRVISRQRAISREILEKEFVETKSNNKKKIKYLKEYREHHCAVLADMLKKLIKDIKKGITGVENRNKEVEIFLQLNLADYTRYLCEATLSQGKRDEYILDAMGAYEKFFILCESAGMNIVNPSLIAGHYHYAIFMYEVLDKKIDAIKYLKEKHTMFVENLDLAYKLYVDSYELLELILATMTDWVVNTDYTNN